MRVNLAHLRERLTSGGYIDFAVFDANATNDTDSGRDRVLQQLISGARAAGLKVDAAALAYEQYGRIRFYGARNIVEYLAGSGLPRWTHTIDI